MTKKKRSRKNIKRLNLNPLLRAKKNTGEKREKNLFPFFCRQKISFLFSFWSVSFFFPSLHYYLGTPPPVSLFLFSPPPPPPSGLICRPRRIGRNCVLLCVRTEGVWAGEGGGRRKRMAGGVQETWSFRVRRYFLKKRSSSDYFRERKKRKLIWWRDPILLYKIN